VVLAGGDEHGVDGVAAASSEVVGGYVPGHMVFGLEPVGVNVCDHYLQGRAPFRIAWGQGGDVIGLAEDMTRPARYAPPH
jgi:hypothetical protein